MRSTFVLLVLALASALALGACGRPKPTPAPRAHSDARFDFRPTAWEAFPVEEAPKKHVVEDLLCAGSCDPLCASLEPRDAARCALDIVYADDADAAYLGRIRIEPVLPVGEYRRHLVWLRDSLGEIDRTFADVARRAPHAVMFRTRPLGFRFFKTPERSYPSAYAIAGIVGYNVEGPLHDSAESVTATLLHEVFHLNDEGHGNWSGVVLAPIFARIVELCGDDHDCLTPYAPSEDLAEGGTYYPFDSRTRDVREYGAELALRWFQEVRRPSVPVFKCRAPENAAAWRALVDEFFGGFDPSPDCG